jgi:hypothetical protein
LGDGESAADRLDAGVHEFEVLLFSAGVLSGSAGTELEDEATEDCEHHVLLPTPTV